MRGSRDIYFEYTPFKLSFGNRFLFRIAKSVFFISLAVGTVIFLLSDVAVVFWAGVIITAFWLYNLVRRRSNRGRFRGGNVANFMDRQARRILETAIDKAEVLGGSFLLNAARELADTYEVEGSLRRLSVPRDEFTSRLDQFLSEERPLQETRPYRLRQLEALATEAITMQGGEKERVDVGHLFRALTRMENERLQRLFALFDLGPDNLANKDNYYIDK